jgi:hypothetical protein
MVVPGRMHRMDAAVYAARYPDLQVVCPAASRGPVEDVVRVHATCEEVLPPLGIELHVPAGVKAGEIAYGVPAGEGRVLVLCDLLFNVPHQPGLGGWILRLVGSSGFFGMTRIGRRFMLEDREVFRGWLLDLADRGDITAISVAHGEAVTGDCAARLREAASRL